MKKTLTIILVILLVVGAGAFSFFYFGTYGEGVRSGQVMKISKRGVVFKTYEGQLNMEGFGAVDTDNQFSEVWEFSIEKSHSEIIEKLEKAALDGERVNLEYVERYSAFPWRGDTKYFVTKVDFHQ